MKLRFIFCLVWLAALCPASAQPRRPGEPESIESTYGASPSTPAEMFQKPPAPAPATAAANLTGNATQNTTADASTSGNSSAAAANGTINPAIAGNATAAAAPGTPTPQPTNPDYSSFPMPISMDNIDNEHHLVPGDKILVQIVEDREPQPKPLFVYENGTIQVPWLNQPMPVEGQTLRDAAEHLKEVLQKDKDGNNLNFYQDGHPTVLATYYSNDHSRGQAAVEGEVNKPGVVSIPMDSILTLADAIQAAGGFNASADRVHVDILHHDLKDGTKDARETVDMTDLMSPVANKIVLPEDNITVPSKTETGAYVHLVGKGVGHSLKIQLQPGGPTTVSEAVQLASTDEFSRLSAVRVLRDKIDQKTGKPVLDPKTGQPEQDEIIVDVGDILYNGHKNKDVPLQNGDYIIVDQNWFSLTH